MGMQRFEQRLRMLELTMRKSESPIGQRTVELPVADEQDLADQTGEVQLQRTTDSSAWRHVATGLEFAAVVAEVKKEMDLLERVRNLMDRRQQIALARKHGYQVVFPRSGA